MDNDSIYHNDLLGGGPDSSRSLSPTPSSANSNSNNMIPSRRTSISCTPLPRVESNSELLVAQEPPETSLVGLLRDSSERQSGGGGLSEVALPKMSPLHHQKRVSRRSSFQRQAADNRSPVRRRSMVSPEDLARVGLGGGSEKSMPHHMMEDNASLAGSIRDGDLDSSQFEVALPKKSPLHRQIKSRNKSTVERMGSNVSQTSGSRSRRPSSASYASNNSPTRGRSLVDPQDLIKAGLRTDSSGSMDLPVMDSVTVTTTSLMRDVSDILMEEYSRLEVTLPKRSPLRHHVQNQLEAKRMSISDGESHVRRGMSLSDRGTQAIRRMSFSEREAATADGDSSHSTVRRSVVDPEDLVKAGLKSSPHRTKQHMSAVVGPMRDTSDMDSSQIEVALPKKSPLRHHIQSRQSATVERKGSNVSQTSWRRTSIPSQQEDSSNHSSSVRRSVVNPEDLVKAGLLLRSSHHSNMTETSGLTSVPDAASTAVVGPMRDSSEREGAAIFEVALPKRSPLHQQQQQQQTRRHSYATTNSNNSSGHSSSQVRRSLVNPEDLIKAGLLLRNSLHSMAEDSGYFTQATSCTIVEEEEDLELEEEAVEASSVAAAPAAAATSSSNNKPVRRSATDSQALAGLRRSMADNKYGLRISHSSMPRSYTPPSGSSHTMSSISTSTSDSVDRDAKIKAGLRNSVLDDARIKAGLRNSALAATAATSAATSTGSSIVDNDARIKAGLRNSTLAAAAASSASINSSTTTSIDNDLRIKAGLRASRIGSVIETAPAIPGAAFVRASTTTAGVGDVVRQPTTTRTNSLTRGNSDLSAQDARIKAGLRHSTGSSTCTPPRASAATRAGSDLCSSDGRIKAGLRNSMFATSNTTAMRSEQQQPETSRTPTKSGLRSPQFGLVSSSPTSTASLTPDSEVRNSIGSAIGSRGLRRTSWQQVDSARTGKGGDSQQLVGVASTDSSTSSASMVADDSQRPGAYRASIVQVEQQEIPLTIERVDPIHRGGMAVLGREGAGGSHHQDSFSSNHDRSLHIQPRSDHFSMASSLEDLDLEAQSTRDVPPFADVAPIQESPKEDDETKGGSRRKLLTCAIVAGIMVLAIVGVVVGVVIGGGSSKSSSSPSSSSSSSPAASTSSSRPNEGNSPSTPLLEEVFGDFVSELPAETIVTIQYGKAGDPQVKAYKWLVNDPNLVKYSIPQRKQRMALAAFYHATNGHRWFAGFDGDVENPWLDYDTHECDWFSLAPLQQGSVCNTTLESPLPLFEHYEYTSLDLTGREIITHNSELPNPRLSGALIPELAMLSTLRRLDVSSNKLRGSIPNGIEPWLSSLEEIVLFDNGLTGTIPHSLYSNARKLWLGINDFEPSVIPPTIGPELTSLSLTDTNTKGSIPPQLFNPNLKELFLGENKIGGPIPTEIGTASSLTVLELNQNQISSSLPTELGLVTDCKVLRFFQNWLTGTLPSELARLSALEELMVSTYAFANKDLEGTIPHEFFVAPSSEEGGNNGRKLLEGEEGLNETLSIYGTWNNNNDSGKQEKLRPAFPNMKHLLLEDTKLSGRIPTQIGLTTSMVGLYMGWNEMLGSIPSEVGLMTQLEAISLTSSILESTIPSELGLLTKLTRLELQDNKLSGSFPPELGPLGESLEEFLVDGNYGLGGTVPPSFCTIDDLAFGCDALCGCDCNCTQI